MTTETKPGPFAASGLCNFRRIGSRWMLDFMAWTPQIVEGSVAENAGVPTLLDVATITNLQEAAPSGQTRICTDKGHWSIAMHPWNIMRDCYESCMWAAEKWRHEQELRAEDSDSIDAQLRRVNRNWMDLDKGPSDSSLEQIVEETDRMLDAARSSLQSSAAKTKRKAARQVAKKD